MITALPNIKSILKANNTLVTNNWKNILLQIKKTTRINIPSRLQCNSMTFQNCLQEFNEWNGCYLKIRICFFCFIWNWIDSIRCLTQCCKILWNIWTTWWIHTFSSLRHRSDKPINMRRILWVFVKSNWKDWTDIWFVRVYFLTILEIGYNYIILQKAHVMLRYC